MNATLGATVEGCKQTEAERRVVLSRPVDRRRDVVVLGDEPGQGSSLVGKPLVVEPLDDSGGRPRVAFQRSDAIVGVERDQAAGADRLKQAEPRLAVDVPLPMREAGRQQRVQRGTIGRSGASAAARSMSNDPGHTDDAARRRRTGSGRRSSVIARPI